MASSLVREIQRGDESGVRLRTGIVASINDDARLVTVKFAADAFDAVEIPKVANYAPQVDDVVVVMVTHQRMYVIGSLGATSTESVVPHNHDAAYINASGDTMTGELTLNGDPTAPEHAATKNYVDTNGYPFYRQETEPPLPRKLGTWWYNAPPL